VKRRKGGLAALLRVLAITPAANDTLPAPVVEHTCRADAITCEPCQDRAWPPGSWGTGPAFGGRAS
jgi:hypothetical protein